MANTLEEHAPQADATDNRWEVMAGLYCEKLTNLLSTLDLGEELGAELTVRHYFNGAAVYVNGTICASWSPVGLAFKLPAEEADELIASGQAKPLKYFAKRPIKKGYVLFDNPESKQQSVLRGYFLKAARLARASRTETVTDSGEEHTDGANR